ncbi:MAG: DEAD/DEAH box helicase [Planctomycetaceae bacterium]|nr:DEAD/DEAH box helicase [Planctomycetaceae bacterium]
MSQYFTSPNIGCTEFPLEVPIEIFITGWNRNLQRPPEITVQKLFPSEAAAPPKLRIVSVPIPRRSKVDSRSWFFYQPLEQDGGLSPSARIDENVGLTPSAANHEKSATNQSLLHKDVDELTRIHVPRDAIKIEDRLSYILQPPIESFLNQKTLAMPFEPFQYQRQGVAFLYSAEFAILADEMGLGKTMQAITTIRLLLHSGEIRNVLLVCPKQLLSNWKREFDAWAPEINVQIIDGSPARRKWLWQLPGIPVRIANYELLHRDREYFDFPLHEGNQKCPMFDLVVLDESQRIKNKDSATSHAARAIQRRRNWALTGTPVENSQEDLVGIFEFLAPGFLNSGLRPNEICNVAGPHILRRTKENVMPHLPPKLIRDALLDLTPTQFETYKKAEDEGVLRLKNDDVLTVHLVFELIIRLKQICNFDPYSGESAKLERLVADMEEVAASGRKAIVFSQWVETLKQLKEHLAQFGIEEYHGSVPQNKRDKVIERFREDGDIHVMLMSYGAGSVGLNLQFAEYVFLFDRWWNPAVEDQAINRAHRLGTKNPVFITRFIAKDTVEERIDRVLQEKRELSEMILSGARGLNHSTGLNQEEIFGLFNLQVPLQNRSRKSA